mmetsp:Transcript_19294/g.34918  ORF Transcript_19294/g.34918 Transcript_19294/m.34918 type:complete len:210 (-) Transcript_19294:153-782(-)
MTSIIRVKVYVRGKHGFHLGNLEPFWFLAGIGSSIFRLSMAIVDVTTVHDQRSLLRRIEGHYRLVYDQGIACDDLGTLGRRIPLLPFESSDLFFFQFPHVFHVLPLAGLFFQFRLADVTFHDRTCPGGRMSGGPGAFAFVETVIPSWRWTLLLLSLLLLLLWLLLHFPLRFLVAIIVLTSTHSRRLWWLFVCRRLRNNSCRCGCRSTFR